MKRREFIAGIGSTAAWPVVTRAQQPEHLVRVGVLMQMGESDQQGQLRVMAFQQGLAKLGWTHGRNIGIVCARARWWAHHQWRRLYLGTSRADHRCRGPAPFARDLSF
jgi:putative ABC transport system substrate-binding protein